MRFWVIHVFSSIFHHIWLYFAHTAQLYYIWAESVKSVYSNLQIVPPYYIKGDRKLSVIHARLRNNCSNLKHDLYTNFVEPDFSCRCGYSCENANHYLFICSLYLNERVELFHSTVSYHPLSLRTLLFGDQNLSTEDNFIIFRAVHRFIKETKRFDIWSFFPQH